MKFEKTHLKGCVLITPQVFEDERGFFMETFHEEKFKSNDLPSHFVQDNHSKSSKGILRGLHFQHPNWQGKLVRVISGEVFDVAVDLRVDSETYGQWYGTYLSETNRQQLYVPEGFAHGFCVTSEWAQVCYKCTRVYAPQEDNTLAWDDPDIAIEWPVVNPVLSAKDQKGYSLKHVTEQLQSKADL